MMHDHTSNIRWRKVFVVVLCFIAGYVATITSSIPQQLSQRGLTAEVQLRQEDEEYRITQQEDYVNIDHDGNATGEVIVGRAFRPYRELEQERGRPHLRQLEELRVCNFGASASWGAGLEYRGFSYPYQISSTVYNFALHRTGPNYPETCLQTMIGDNRICDLITVDFPNFGEPVYNLVKRLRRRFPDAKIVLLDYWTPFRMVLENIKTFEQVSYQDWVDNVRPQIYTGARGTDNYKVLPGLRNTALEEQHSYGRNWQWKYTGGWDSDYIEKMKYEFGVTTIGLNANRQTMVNDPIGTMVKDAELFQNNGIYMNPNGHYSVAQLILQYIQSVKYEPNQARIRQWDKGLTPNVGDSCDVWYADGETTLGHSKNVRMKKYGLASSKKHALFFPQTPGEVGKLEVFNDFPRKKYLYISFIVSETNEYPRVRVRCETATPPVKNKIIETKVDEDLGGGHAARTLSICRLPPTTNGKPHVIEFEALPGNHYRGIRVVGASVVNPLFLPEKGRGFTAVFPP